MPSRREITQGKDPISSSRPAGISYRPQVRSVQSTTNPQPQNGGTPDRYESCLSTHRGSRSGIQSHVCCKKGRRQQGCCYGRHVLEEVRGHYAERKLYKVFRFYISSLGVSSQTCAGDIGTVHGTGTYQYIVDFVSYLLC